MNAIAFRRRKSKKTLCASSVFLKVRTFVGMSLIAIGVSSAHAAPHIHGEGKLQILQAGNDWQLVLQLPAADVLGFEHTPTTDDEIRRYENTQDTFLRFNDIFTLSSVCELLDTTLEIPWKVGVAHDEYESEYNRDAHRNSHTDFRVAYLLSCHGPLKSIEMTGFTHWPSLRHINAIWVTSRGQGAQDITPKQPTLQISS